jgi:RsiW-degrading membrane proteinase PrsW (M82 family)
MLVYAVILYWLDRYEKEPVKMLLGVFLWGSFVAALGAFLINTLAGASIYLFTQSENLSQMTVTVLIAPFVEESLKGLAVLFVLLFFYSEYNSILDGIIYAGITALGFAATENAYYIFQYGFMENGWNGLFQVFILRSLQMGWTHPFYSSFIGIGLAIARPSKKLLEKLLALLVGWSLSISTHTIHNTIAYLISDPWVRVIRLIWDWGGWLVVTGIIIWATDRERRFIQIHLGQEVEEGLLTPSQYKTASSARRQWLSKLKALSKGHFKETHRFYQLCGELSHLKQRRKQPDEIKDTSDRISSLRKQLASLSAQLQ